MRTFIRSLLLLPLLAMVMTSCSDYGKKVKIEGTKGEIFYKGKGVTESDAKNLGEFLKKDGFLSNDKAASIQVTKEGEHFLVRFVYDKAFFDKTPGLEDVFKLYGARMTKEVFAGTKTDIALADETMKDFKNIPFDEATAKTLDVPKEDVTKLGPVDGEAKTGALSDYQKQVEGGITFYWRAPITTEEARIIRNAVVSTGDFGGGSPETTNIFIDKEGDKYYVKFPVADQYLEDAPTLSTLEGIGRKIKDAAFANVPFSFVMMDVKLNNVQSWTY